MRKFLAILLSVISLSVLTACTAPIQEPASAMELQLSQMRSICELATTECYFHNVAKGHEDKSWFLARDKDFWIEYDGIVTLGIDASLVEFTVDGTTVTITLPPAQVQDCNVDSASLTEESFIIAKGSAEISAEDQTDATAQAQADMLETASANKMLLANAQQRARQLLEEYVRNIGNAIGVDYTVKFEYILDE